MRHQVYTEFHGSGDDTNCILYCTLFKLKKSSEWKWHTVIASISVCIHSRDSKFVIIDKICRHPFSSNMGKMSNLSILCSFRLICYFFCSISSDFCDIDYFGTRRVQTDRKCWFWGVSFSLRTFSKFEQCVLMISLPYSK